MEKCIGCSFYDRQNGSNTDSRGVSWGQCRRTAPALHPVNQKSFMIEGVWPHVRDDDWCGEYKGSSRRAEPRAGTDAISSNTLLPIAGASPLGGRPANVAAFASASVRDEPPVSLGPLVSARGGTD